MNLAQPYDARAVANFILDKADEDGVALTQLSLLKILYFAHGWYLAEHAKPLIAQPIEAWQYGPVIKVVRDAFKDFGKKAITKRAEKLEVRTGEIVPVVPDLLPSDRAFVSAVYNGYRHHDGWTLSEMTHEQGSPWFKVWHPDRPSGSLGLRIRNEDIRKHFLEIPQRFSLQ